MKKEYVIGIIIAVIVIATVVFIGFNGKNEIENKISEEKAIELAKAKVKEDMNFDSNGTEINATATETIFEGHKVYKVIVEYDVESGGLLLTFSNDIYVDVTNGTLYTEKLKK
ncbi:MAG: hypothetical protein LBU74_04250 [Methanobacteriaceae archaeon]|jgi:predicted small secreted protein|nr:hypothetical protein [Candidatus Methanorudis spinitermitis]